MRFAVAAMVTVLAMATTGCGNGGGKTTTAASSSTPLPSLGRQLTQNDLPDVLMPGIWPGASLRAYRNGDSITIKTSWGDAGTTVDGRSTHDAAQSICQAALGDLGYDMSLSVAVLAANGWEHLAFKSSGGNCDTA